MTQRLPLRYYLLIVLLTPNIANLGTEPLTLWHLRDHSRKNYNRVPKNKTGQLETFRKTIDG